MRRAVPVSGTALAGAALALGALSLASCRDISGFSTEGGSYGGEVVGASFVLAGMQQGTMLCLTLDTNHLQDAPGSFSTSDGMFSHVPFRPIPQIWHDTLSTLAFGEGRLKNLLYVATPSTDPPGEDVFAVLSLMQSGHIEVRLLRGAPATPDSGAAGPANNIFAIFDLTRSSGPCSF